MREKPQNIRGFHLSSFTNDVYMSLLPPGPIWEIAEDEELDLLLQALGENMDGVSEFLEDLANIRNPKTTPILSDLEKEFGVSPGTQVSEATRRLRLNSRKYKKMYNGSKSQMQEELNASGFTDVFVNQNNPTIDPSIYDGSILVNNLPNNGDQKYALPTNPTYWPMVFFVSGTVTRDINGNITNIEKADIPIERIDEFREIVMRNKPLHSWAYLIIELTQDQDLDFGFDLVPDAQGFGDVNNINLGGTFVSI